MPFDSLGKWWPDYTLHSADDQIAPLTPEPPVAAYPVRRCLYCDAFTTREACSRCQACKLSVPFGSLRERVRNGQLTDWPDQQWTHTEMQTIWMCGAQKWQGAERILLGILDRAVSRGFAWHHNHSRTRHQTRQWFFHPEYFTNDGDGKAAA
jgi:hypothetical protein